MYIYIYIYSPIRLAFGFLTSLCMGLDSCASLSPRDQGCPERALESLHYVCFISIPRAQGSPEAPPRFLEAKQSKAKQSKAKQSKANQAAQSKAQQPKANHTKPKQSKATQRKAKQSKAKRRKETQNDETQSKTR